MAAAWPQQSDMPLQPGLLIRDGSSLSSAVTVAVQALSPQTPSPSNSPKGSRQASPRCDDIKPRSPKLRPQKNEPQPLQPGSVRPAPAGLITPPAPEVQQSLSIAAEEKQGQCRTLPKEYRHGHVPRHVNLEEEYKASAQGQVPITTVMIRNIPNRYTQKELIAELEDLGLAGTFDFLYIPLDKGTMSNVGYAFVNFIQDTCAEKCMTSFQNYRFRRHRKISGKIAAISVAHIQGLDANLAHYEKAAVNTAKLKQRRPVVIANISKSLTTLLSQAYAEEDDEAECIEKDDEDEEENVRR